MTSYSSSEDSLRINVLIPVSVHDKMVPYLGPERNFRAEATFGPKFLPDAAPSAIASDFTKVLQFLSVRGCIQSDSLFLRELAVLLEKVSRENKRISSPLTAKPLTEFERGLEVVIKLSLFV